MRMGVLAILKLDYARARNRGKVTTAPSAVASTAEPAKEKTPVVAQQGLIQNLGVACVSRAMEAQLVRCVPAVTMAPAIHRHLRPCVNVIFLILGPTALSVDVSTVVYVQTPQVAIHFTGVSAKIILTPSQVVSIV